MSEATPEPSRDARSASGGAADGGPPSPVERSDDPILDGLTPSQREAVMHGTGPLLVVAGPGSGKTRVITRRVARLIRDGVPPPSILAITFTNKAAAEMARRVREITPAEGAWLRTFHSTCAAILRRWPEPAGLRAGFTIYDQDEQSKIVRAALKRLDIPSSQLKPSEALHAISRWKADGVTPAEALDDRSWILERQMRAKVYDAYVTALRENNAVDFDDLLSLTKKAVEDDDALRERLQQRFEHVLIDEYQDTSPVQFHLARLLAMRTRNIFAVGDPDQSIYAFRKADIRNILDFEQHFPGARVIRLEENFRSSSNVLSAADALIAHNTDRRKKRLVPTKPPGEKVRVVSFWTEREEGDAVADMILSAYQRGVPYRDVAVFYRTNAQSRSLEAGLRSRGIPYTIVKGVEFFQRAEVKDVLSYLRVLANPSDRESMSRVISTPSRGVGEKSIEKLFALAREQRWSAREALRRGADHAGLPQRQSSALRAVAEMLDTVERGMVNAVAAILEDVLRLANYEHYLREAYDEEWEERWANVRELVQAAREFDEAHGAETSVVGFLTHVGLVSDVDKYDPDAPRVPLMTLHSAKGLEFREVFLTGVEEGVLPHSRSADDRAALEEERRLLFVGITRAKDRLTISYCAERSIRIPGSGSGRSRFLDELPQDALDEDRTRGPASISQGHGGDWKTFGVHGGGAHGGGTHGGGTHGGGARTRWRDDPAASEGVDEPPAWPARGAGPASGALGARRAAHGASDDFAPDYAAGDDPSAGLAVGARVHHPVFGNGQIVRLQGRGPSSRVTVRFSTVGEKTLALAFAKLRPL